jgi:CheY-like chemotaxis protein/two-component sensor histidine kinase
MRLVDDLLEVSRITLGQLNLRSERVNLQMVLEDAFEALAPEARARSQRMTIDIPADELPISGDSTRLAQVFQNLLDNAVKYTPERGEISVRAVRKGQQVEVSVSDDGIGVPVELQTRIFDLFTRVHPSDPIKSSGLGIGLALARQLVELHQGKLEVRSDGTGRGSEFIVTLPLDASMTAASDGSRSAGVKTPAPTRVLVVDDNRDAAETLTMILQMSGHEAETMFSGAEALERVAVFKPDVVLTDIGMPGMDGYEVARRLRADPATRELRIIALTGWGQAQDKERALAAGFNLHLTKPVDPEELDSLLA